MNPIKFRAWFEGHMYEVAKLDFWGDPDQASCDLAGTGENGEWEELFDIYVSDVELMQYTCLKDKNGVEVYEGDIVAFLGIRWDGPDGDRVDYVGIVRYSDEHTSFNFEINNGLLATTFEADDVKVIGNIHDNPELMEVE